MDEFERIKNLFHKGYSISEIANECIVSQQKVRKILITTGDLVNATSKEVSRLHNQGLLVNQIAEQLGLSVSAVNSYLPYKKGLYMSSTPSKNALNIRKCREQTDKTKLSKNINETTEASIYKSPILTTATLQKNGSKVNKATNKKKYKKSMVHVWGEQAVFQRAEIKHDICSYDIITPSAARGIMESIYWHPGMRWIIDNIYVINPIRYMPDKVTLKDVDYIIEAHFEMTADAAPSDNEGKFKDIFLRRLHRKETHKPIYFGSRKYPAQFEAFSENIDSIKSYYRKSLKDLGILFYDFDYINEDEPMFFRAVLKYGVLSLQDIDILK